MTIDVLFGWGHTGCNQVLAASNLVTLTDWRAMLAKLQKWSSSVMCTYVKATVLSLPIQGVAYAGCLCQCRGRGLAGWLLPTVGRKVPRSLRCHLATADASRVSPNSNHRHFLESCAITFSSSTTIDQLLFLLSEWWSLSCWSLNNDFKHNHWQISGCSMSCRFHMTKCKFQSSHFLTDADFTKLTSSPNHGQTDFKPVGDFRFLSSRWNELVLGLCLNWMTHVLGKLLLVLDAELAIGKHVWDVWMPQQSKRTRLAKQCFQGSRGILLKSPVCVWPDASCFCEQIVSWMLLQASSNLIR